VAVPQRPFLALAHTSQRAVGVPPPGVHCRVGEVCDDEPAVQGATKTHQCGCNDGKNGSDGKTGTGRMPLGHDWLTNPITQAVYAQQRMLGTARNCVLKLLLMANKSQSAQTPHLAAVGAPSAPRWRPCGCRGTLSCAAALPSPRQHLQPNAVCSTLIKQQCCDQSARPIVPEAELPGAECDMPNLAARHNESMRREGSTCAPTCSRALYSACACACSACCCRCMACAADICCGGGPAPIIRPCSQGLGFASLATLAQSHAASTALVDSQHHM
jgi:hypothetical protein